MNKTLNIYSEIVDDGGKWTEKDVCPSDFRQFADELSSGDEVTLNINSVGGSVLAGVSIANQIKALNAKGIHTTARIEGLCASIATVIMCACEKIVMDNTSFIMIHNCWTFAQGDSNELRKQADVMDTMNDVMMTFYKSKFGLSEDELKKLMDEETWFSGSEAKDFKLDCEVIESEVEYKIAASLKRFKNIPERVLNMKKKADETPIEEEVKKEIVEEIIEKKQEEETLTPTEEEKVEEVVKEVTDEEKTPEELKEEIKKLTERISDLEAQLADCQKELADCQKKGETTDGEEKKCEETITKEECEKRVSGMQAKMQTQINDFKNQLKAKDEELTKAMAQVTSLTDDLKNSTDELLKMTSAFEEKTKALDMLNANVNAHAEELPTLEEGLAKCASPAEKVAFLKSGKYVGAK